MVKQTPQSSPPSERSDSKYKGVRKRKWGKWVSEIRLPNSRERIWLGSYDSAEKAARAFDAALFCLRGRNAKFNFPDSPPNIDGGRHLTPSEIQAAAARFANSAASSSSSPSNAPRSHSDSELHMDRSPSPSASEGTVHMDSDPSLDVLDGSIWDLVVDNNNATINCNYNYNYSYENMNNHNDSNNTNTMGLIRGSGEYPTEYGIFPGFDDLSSDFYAPTLPPVDHGEENFDGLINQSSFLWNF